MKNMSKKIVAILLTMCIILSGMVTAFATTNATDPAYKMLFDKGEIFRTTNISTSQAVTFSFDYYLAEGGVTVDDTYSDSVYTTALKAGSVSSFSLTVPNSSQTHSFRLTAKSLTAELYIWNVKITKSDSSEITFENYTDRTTCEFTEITYADIPEMVEKNFVLLVDTTSLADDGNDNKSFWFNELGMSGYGDLPNGTYTVQFDVCPVKLAESGSKFHFRTSNGQAEGAWAGFWQPELTVGEWTTTSSTFTVTDDTTTGNHILFVYGGFKGYVDNLVILDSEGNEVAGTYTDMGGLYVPDKHVDYLTFDYFVVEDEPEVELSDDYAIYQDSSAATTNYDTYFHCYDYSTYGSAEKHLPSGEYTVTMDVYAQAIGDLVYKPIKDWANADEQKYWTPTEDDLNKWVTVTYTGTTTTGANLHTIIYCQGFKGYVDNITVYSGDTEIYKLSFTESDNGKAGHDSNGAGVVGALPQDIADAKAPVVVPTTNDMLLVDTTDNANNTPKDFWFNELGMSGYGSLPNGTYTIQFDVYPVTIPEGGNLFHFRTGSGSGPSSDAGFWKPELTVGEWTTTSNTFTVTDTTTTGNHILYVYGGFRGCVDNLVILDADGNEVAGTRTGITGLTIPEKHIAILEIVDELPHIHTAAAAVIENIINPTCVVSSSYDEVVYCETCGEELSRNTVTNDMLLIDTTANANNTPKDFWFNNLGMAGYGTLPNGTYTIQFDVYPVTIPEGGNLFHFRTGSGSGPSSDAGWWKPELTVGEWTTTSNTFTVTDATTTGNHILYVYGGFKGCVDNLVILDADCNDVAGTRTGFTGLTVNNNYKDYLTISDKLAHTAGETKIENTVAADCVTNGSHDEVVYCTVCDAEISRNTVTDTAPGHQFTTVPEQPSTDCLTHGVAEHKHCSVCGYDYATGASNTEPFENALKAEDLQLPVADHTELKDNGKTVYAMTESGHAKVCAVCDEEFGFEGHTGDFVPNGASGHTGECTVCGLELSAESGHNFNGDNVCDECDWTCTSHNFVDGDVINAGDCTTDKVVATYCTICGIAGENNVTTAPGHTPGTAVRENEVETSCKAPGSYDEVVYCTVETCKAELSRENKTIDQLAHTPGTPVRENEVGASCTAPGSYDEVVYCTVENCKAELSRVNKPIDQLPHTPGSSWEENRVNDCINGNSYEIVTNCGVCFEEISRVEHTDEATGHDIYDYDEVSATCSWEGWNAHSQCLICGKHFEFGTTDKFSEDYISEEEVYTDVIADAHSWVEVESIAPDYENEGKIGYKYCEYCNKFVYGDKELDLEIDYDALYEEIDPLLNDAYDALWEEFTAENPEPDENASNEEWNEYYAAFEELWMPVHDSIYMPAYIEALEAAAAAEGVEFEVAVLEREDDNKDDYDADADNKQDGDTTDSTDDKTDNGTEDKVDGDKSETSPITGEKFAVVVAALTAVIAAGFVLVFKAKKVY